VKRRTTDAQIIDFVAKWLRHAPEKSKRAADQAASFWGEDEEMGYEEDNDYYYDY
jgi:hypothetical protein